MEAWRDAFDAAQEKRFKESERKIKQRMEKQDEKMETKFNRLEEKMDHQTQRLQLQLTQLVEAMSVVHKTMKTNQDNVERFTKSYLPDDQLHSPLKRQKQSADDNILDSDMDDDFSNAQDSDDDASMGTPQNRGDSAAAGLTRASQSPD